MITEALTAGAPGDPPRQPLELWVAETSTGEARCLLKSPQMGINATFDECAPCPAHHMPRCTLLYSFLVLSSSSKNPYSGPILSLIMACLTG